MSKLNTKNTNPKRNGEATNHKGTMTATKSDRFQLYEIVVSTMYGQDGFYESTDERVRRLDTLTRKLVMNGDAAFIANTILVARHAMNIRSMPIVLTIVFAKALRDGGVKYENLRSLVKDVIVRADQAADMFAVAKMYFGDKKSIPMAVKRGISDALNKFDEYQFAKYDRAGEVKMSDLLRIVHPVPKDSKQGEIFKAIMTDSLKTPYTWETELSKNGQLEEGERKDKSTLWGELVTSGKMGYMALLRNLRNISQAKVRPGAMKTVYERIADPEEVAKSRQLPFRFINAYENTKQLGDNHLVRALGRAIDASVGNIPELGKNVWIIIDCSGSMTFGRGTSIGSPMKTAALFGAALAKANGEADNLKITMFSNNSEHVSVNSDDTILGIHNTLMRKVYGGGTNLQSALDKKNTLGFEPDTVIVLSDMEVDRLNNNYRDATNIFTEDTVKVAINLNSNATTPIGEKQGWYQLAGFSDRIFDFIPAMRNKVSLTQALAKAPYLGTDAKNYKPA